MSLVVIVQRCQRQLQLDQRAVRQITVMKVAYFLSSGSQRQILFLYLFHSTYIRRTSTGRSLTSNWMQMIGHCGTCAFRKPDRRRLRLDLCIRLGPTGGRARDVPVVCRVHRARETLYLDGEEVHK